MLKLTVFVFWRVQYDGLSGRAVLIKIIALNILVLNHQEPRGRPLAPGIKADFTDATNYQIDIFTNKITGAKFSLPDAVNLLESLRIELVG